jgi:hypothetical protein
MKDSDPRAGIAIAFFRGEVEKCAGEFNEQ